MQSPLREDHPNAEDTKPSGDRIRGARWRIFLYLFGATCVAIALDVVTTYLGFQQIGSRFEHNAIALYLINRIGWVGLTALLTFTCVVCLKSFKLVYWNLSLHWSRWLNVLVFTVCVFRWIVVVTDTMWLISR